jgi:hypothetical protein
MFLSKIKYHNINKLWNTKVGDSAPFTSISSSLVFLAFVGSGELLGVPDYSPSATVTERY